MSDNYGDDDRGDDFGDDEEINSDDSHSHDFPSSQDNEDDEDQNKEMEQQQNENEEDEDEIASKKSIEIVEQQQFVPQKANTQRITSPFMTKYQKAKIIGVRAVQISKNSPLYLNFENIANLNWDPLTIAQKQLSQNKIPFIIRRFLPDGSYQDWKLSELKTFDF